MNEPPIHLVIPDTQVKPGVPTAHLDWIGQYIVDQFEGKPLTVVHLGDHWDLPSLSSYDKGKGQMEGRRLHADVKAGDDGLAKLDGPLDARDKKRRNVWSPRKVLLRGNHEHRLTRAAENDAQLEGLVGTELLDTRDWEVHDFLAPVEIDGVTYAHYFYNPNTSRPYAGANLETRLKTVGHSFTMGHQQGLKWGRVETIRRSHIGLVAGSCYLHDEDYLGPQSINYWRGIVACHQVEDGNYDPMFIGLDYLCRRYEGMRLTRYLSKLKWRK